MDSSIEKQIEVTLKQEKEYLKHFNYQLRYSALCSDNREKIEMLRDSCIKSIDRLETAVQKIAIKKAYSDRMESNADSFTMGKLLDVVVLLEDEGKQGSIEYLQTLETLRRIMKGM